jgi:aminoglycoside phosphotransferase (APT) family kinase protein
VKDLAADPGPLEEAVRAALGPAARSPVNIQRLSAGASSHIWSFDLPDHTPTGYILRVSAPGPNRVAIATEVAAMEAARDVQVPVPPILFHSDEAQLFGAPYMLMERVQGETLARHILRDDDYGQARRAFGEQCGRILGRLRKAETANVPGLVEDQQLERWEEIFRFLDTPVATFEWAFRYLYQNRVQANQDASTLVHGDFRLGNMILGPEGLRAILDWELVHLGNPLEDLGWLCARPWRFRGPSPVGGMGEYDELIDAYGDESGVDIDREELRWWEVFATLRWGVICLLQASRHLGGSERSVELATIGRRVAETELDLLDCVP